SCLYPAAKLHGKHLITIEGLGTPEDLHPIQSALLEHHGTQCGYCTPGFVMSMFALFAMLSHPDEETILAALEGNLCRCTGYQSILDAARQISRSSTPSDIVPRWCRDVEPLLFSFDTLPETAEHSSSSQYQIESYYLPETLSQLHELLLQHPRARLIAGGTDIMVQVNIARQHFETLIDISRIKELKLIRISRDGIHIGAGVTYSQILASGIVKTDLPALTGMIRLIASQQIRNFGTLAGNVANASPIGDSIPVLLVYEASLVISSQAGERTIPLRDFFLGYRKTALQAGELLREIIVPIPPRDSFIRFLKSSKRKAVDISSIASAIRLDAQEGMIQKGILALAGVAATPVISAKFAKLTDGKFIDKLNLEDVSEVIAEEFEPLSDVRGSNEYRIQMIKNHLAQYALMLKEAKHG
ncbi:MAG TPA: FAD binding domain-containing protein, partial [Methanothrix sp.]|nr:FAD binding domain-containing protein [Methanothrix sp.]